MRLVNQRRIGSVATRHNAALMNLVGLLLFCFVLRTTAESQTVSVRDKIELADKALNILPDDQQYEALKESIQRSSQRQLRSFSIIETIKDFFFRRKSGAIWQSAGSSGSSSQAGDSEKRRLLADASDSDSVSPTDLDAMDDSESDGDQGSIGKAKSSERNVVTV